MGDRLEQFQRQRKRAIATKIGRTGNTTVVYQKLMFFVVSGIILLFRPFYFRSRSISIFDRKKHHIPV
ncbi:hypothetical protein CVD25_22880 [Bacillus canaveralius]|uniref:Uncharacterized protein n=1 Tax=Bacillus canaveralius TaxID=1403243 RepID=A0A2N5GGE4_9BACI|nr:hypothetical protein CU635_21230 [Bacillus canaveralius]PLR88301.1 hypothetical protein CVD25_22880 [Bacillus canaveralius]